MYSDFFNVLLHTEAYDEGQNTLKSNSSVAMQYPACY